eukprot:m.125669 g.125669  ORF g.125669 m.125669 type:complete len:168 (+) comp15626_c4_seq1:175-678(+)
MAALAVALRAAARISLRSPARLQMVSAPVAAARSFSSSLPVWDRYFTESHEWLDVQGNIATVGITNYAQEALGDIVYVDLPEVGAEFDKEEEFGSIESVKAASELYAPCNGTVTAVNEQLQDSPGLVNESAEQDGWIIKLEVTSPEQLDALMNEQQYQDFLKASRDN